MEIHERKLDFRKNENNGFLDKLTIPLGTWFKIPVYCHFSLTIMMIAGTIFGGPKYLGMILAVFGSVLLHEFGHSLMAQKLRFTVPKIVLYCVGGCAFIQLNGRLSRDEFKVTVAGPAVSAVLAAVFFCFAKVHPAFLFIAQVNLVLLVFNMIPAWPMDGGRILRSSLSIMMNNFHRANKIALTTSIICGGLMIITGLFYGQIILAVIGGLAIITSRQEAKQTGAFHPSVKTQAKIFANNKGWRYED